MNTSKHIVTDDLVHASDALACELYNRKLYQASIDQNNITLQLVGNKHPSVLKNMANAYYFLKNPEKSEEIFKEYLDITGSTDKIDIRQYGQYLTRSGRIDEGFEYLLKNRSESNEFHLDMGWYLLKQGRFKESFIETEMGRNGAVWIGKKYPPNCPRLDKGNDIRGKKLCVIGEAGLGDEIIFSRWIRTLKERGTIVYYYTDNTLKNVITRTFDVLPHDLSVRYDYWVPTMSLPYLLEIEEPGTDAYLSPNPLYVAKWREKLKQYDNIIALNWTGDKDHMENGFRTIPIDYLVSKLKDKGTLVSICLGAETQPEGVIDLTKDIQSWDDTLAILSISNLCYTSCSSVVHAAGAVGTKTNLYDTVFGYFTWSDKKSGEKSRWYPDVTVWRQEKMSDWCSIIDKSIS